jgi:hypothetical protein
MSVFYFSAFIIFFPDCSSQSSHYQCTTSFTSTVNLVENSSIEFGCKVDFSVREWFFTRKGGNASISCKFTNQHLTIDECEFSERFSFVGNLTDNKIRLRIDPVLEKGCFYKTSLRHFGYKN